MIVAVLVLGVPLVINEAYRAGNGYLTLWGAEDVLAFYGTIFAAAGTGLGVFFSIKYSHKQYEDDKRRYVLPFFSMNTLSQIKVDPFLKGFAEGAGINVSPVNATEIEGLSYKEYLDDKIYFFIEDSGISYDTKMTAEQKKKAEMDEEAVIEMLGNPPKDSAIYIANELRNVGNGCAINMFISIHSESNEKAFSNFVPVPVGEKLYFGLYIARTEQVIGKYRIDLNYQDIFGNIYSQSRMLSIEHMKLDDIDMIAAKIWTESEARQQYRHSALN